MTEPEQGDEMAWDLSVAIKDMGAAQASGDPEQIAVATHRYAEALINSGYKRMMPTFERTLKAVVKPAIDQISDAIDSIRADQNRQFGYLLRELDAEFKTNAAWRDKWESEQGDLAADVREAVRGLGKLKEQMHDLDARHAEQWQQVMQRLDTDEQRLDAKRERIEVLEREVAALKAWRERFDARGGTGDA